MDTGVCESVKRYQGLDVVKCISVSVCWAVCNVRKRHCQNLADVSLAVVSFSVCMANDSYCTAGGWTKCAIAMFNCYPAGFATVQISRTITERCYLMPGTASTKHSQSTHSNAVLVICKPKLSV